MRVNEKFKIPHAPSTCFSGTQLSTLKSAGLNDPEGPEKHNNTEVKYGQLFTALDTCCCYV
jgi:hypothetical protein